MKKRYLALALAAVLAVCAAGCGKEEAKDDSNKTAEKGTVDTTEILQAQMPEEGEEIAVITTSKGVVRCAFSPKKHLRQWKISKHWQKRDTITVCSFIV